MKKKIKDLTKEECDKFCEKQPDCHGCPFYLNWEYCFMNEMFEEVEVDDLRQN